MLSILIFEATNPFVQWKVQSLQGITSLFTLPLAMLPDECEVLNGVEHY